MHVSDCAPCFDLMHLLLSFPMFCTCNHALIFLQNKLSKMLWPQFVKFIGGGNMSAKKNALLSLQEAYGSDDAMSSSEEIDSQIQLELKSLTEADKENQCGSHLSPNFKIALQTLAKKNRKTISEYIWLRSNIDGASWTGSSGKLAGETFVHIHIFIPSSEGRRMSKIVKMNVSAELYGEIVDEVNRFVLKCLKTGNTSLVEGKLDKTPQSGLRENILLNNPLNGKEYSVETGNLAEETFLHISLPFPGNDKIFKTVEMNLSPPLFNKIDHEVDDFIGANLDNLSVVPRNVKK